MFQEQLASIVVLLPRENIAYAVLVTDSPLR